MESLESSSWAWGLALIALTVAIHAAGIALLGVVTQSIRHRVEGRRRVRFHHLFTVLTVPVGIRDGSCAVGGGILVARRAQLAG
jgi:hypothetical protein